MRRSLQATYPAVGVVIFWGSCLAVLLAFLLPMPWCWLLAIVAIEPVMYGSHEALHGHFVPRAPGSRLGGRRHQEVAAIAGFAVQIMNLYMLRPAHMHHHYFGRYDDGYAPDVSVGKPSFSQRVHYYMSLIGLPGLLWQAAGFARLLLPPSRLPFLVKIRFQEQLNWRYVAAQLSASAVATYMILVGGLLQFVVFNLIFCFLWSLQQNIAHYGLRGVDPETDRLCARSYYLPWPFNWLTFGSTAHFLHHANTSVPAWRLYDEGELRRIEDKLGITVKCSYGLWPFVRDIFKQFKGPVPVADLSIEWMEELNRTGSDAEPGDFTYRRGRQWRGGTQERLRRR